MIQKCQCILFKIWSITNSCLWTSVSKSLTESDDQGGWPGSTPPKLMLVLATVAFLPTNILLERRAKENDENQQLQELFSQSPSHLAIPQSWQIPTIAITFQSISCIHRHTSEPYLRAGSESRYQKWITITIAEYIAGVTKELCELAIIVMLSSIYVYIHSISSTHTRLYNKIMVVTPYV